MNTDWLGVLLQASEESNLENSCELRLTFYFLLDQIIGVSCGFCHPSPPRRGRLWAAQVRDGPSRRGRRPPAWRQPHLWKSADVWTALIGSCVLQAFLVAQIMVHGNFMPLSTNLPEPPFASRSSVEPTFNPWPCT